MKTQDFNRHLLKKNNTPRIAVALRLGWRLRLALSYAGFPNIWKSPEIHRTDGKRPDCTTLISLRSGKSLLLEATIVDTLASSYINTSFK